MHFFTQSFSSLKHVRTILTCRCISVIISSVPSLSLNSLHVNVSVILTPHIHLVILISARWSVNSFSFFTGHVSLSCNDTTMHTTCVQFPSHKKWDILTGKQRYLFHSLPTPASTAASRHAIINMQFCRSSKRLTEWLHSAVYIVCLWKDLFCVKWDVKLSTDQLSQWRTTYSLCWTANVDKRRETCACCALDSPSHCCRHPPNNIHRQTHIQTHSPGVTTASIHLTIQTHIQTHSPGVTTASIHLTTQTHIQTHSPGVTTASIHLTTQTHIQTHSPGVTTASIHLTTLTQHTHTNTPYKLLHHHLFVFH